MREAAAVTEIGGTRSPVAHALAPGREAERRDAFPHTKRPLPWFLAGFAAMVFFVPINATVLKVNVGVDSHPDRLAVIVLVLAWLWCGGDQRALLRTRRSKLFVTAAIAYLAISITSLLLNVEQVANLGEFQFAEKQFALLVSFLVVGWFALTALRFEDLRGFASYLIGLAVMVAIGMIVERRTGYNVFYEWSSAILRPIATVEPSPTSLVRSGVEGRINIVGPTLHPLAATAMLMMVMPFALVRMVDNASRRSWCLNATALALMLFAAVETERKTAVVVPVVVVIYFACYRPRQMLRLLPLGLVVLVGLVHFASPGTLGTVLNLGAATKSSSTIHREGDFEAVVPDLLKHPVLGRGYGSVNVEQASEFHVNDNEYVDEVRAVGILGLLAYGWMILAPLALARSAIRKRGPTVASLTLAASAGCLAFLVVSALFDVMGFTEVPYLFFLMAVMTTIAAAGPEGNVVPSRELVRRLAARRPHATAAAEAAGTG